MNWGIGIRAPDFNRRVPEIVISMTQLLPGHDLRLSDVVPILASQAIAD
jgi:hypothetical protein